MGYSFVNVEVIIIISKETHNTQIEFFNAQIIHFKMQVIVEITFVVDIKIHSMIRKSHTYSCFSQLVEEEEHSERLLEEHHFNPLSINFHTEVISIIKY